MAGECNITRHCSFEYDNLGCPRSELIIQEATVLPTTAQGSGLQEEEGSGYENLEFSSGLRELNNQLLKSTRTTELQTSETIQSTEANIPRRHSSHCRDQKIWCKVANCSLRNVQRNCQKTCNLC